MIWEDGYDTGVIWDLILGTPGAEAEWSLVIPGAYGGFGVDGYQHVQVWQPAVELLSQLRFPGHAPELGGRARLSELDKIRDMVWDDVSDAGDAYRGEDPGLGDEFFAVFGMGEVV